MTSRPDPVAAFLERLGRALRPLPPADRAVIVSELEAHIAERRREADAAGVLTALGRPEALARAFLDARASSPTPLGERLTGAARRVGGGLATLATGAAAAVMAVLALVFALIAALKPLLPGHVGLWTTPHAFAFGLLSSPGAPADERLGLWILPAGAGGAIVCALLALAAARSLRAGPRSGRAAFQPA